MQRSPATFIGFIGIDVGGESSVGGDDDMDLELDVTDVTDVTEPYSFLQTSCEDVKREARTRCKDP